MADQPSPQPVSLTVQLRPRNAGEAFLGGMSRSFRRGVWVIRVASNSGLGHCPVTRRHWF